jgi:RNA polymerase sigma factor (sigma-70 family)
MAAWVRGKTTSPNDKSQNERVTRPKILENWKTFCGCPIPRYDSWLMDPTADSISEWLGQLKAGDAEAAQKLWQRYSEQLLRLATQRLGVSPRGIADEEDVALSVFASIFRGAAEGRFNKIKTRDELWWLLLTLTKRKSIDHIRRETAQKRHVPNGRPELHRRAGATAAVPYSLDDLVSSAPTPDFLVALQEQYLRLLDMLRNDQLREIVMLRIEGYTIEEIAQRMSVSLRAVERKLQLIRAKWKRELFSPELDQ